MHLDEYLKKINDELNEGIGEKISDAISNVVEKILEKHYDKKWEKAKALKDKGLDDIKKYNISILDFLPFFSKKIDVEKIKKWDIDYLNEIDETYKYFNSLLFSTSKLARVISSYIKAYSWVNAIRYIDANFYNLSALDKFNGEFTWAPGKLFGIELCVTWKDDEGKHNGTLTLYTKEKDKTFKIKTTEFAEDD